MVKHDLTKVENVSYRNNRDSCMIRIITERKLVATIVTARTTVVAVEEFGFCLI